VGHAHGSALAGMPPSLSNIPADLATKNTMFVGFDIAEIQPRLRDFDNFLELAERISWVHGNLYVLVSPPLIPPYQDHHKSGCLSLPD
jgi:hypothetical protein